MDFAPYQSSPPENSRPFSPPRSTTASPRASLDNNNYNYNRGFASPPPLQHPQPQRNWQHGGFGNDPYASSSAEAEAGVGVGVGGGGEEGGAQAGAYYRDGVVSEFDTSLGIRLDYEACLAYLALPPLGAIILLILERKSDFARFHAWQSSLIFTVIFIIHLLFSWSRFLSWVFILADLCLMGFLALRAYRDADTLDRFEVPFFGHIASRFLDDE
ncbi:hypothetical protein F4778DRAFT_733672 [Xylariomycetidae sp. FL2044]|nr:hypothetical protein F4778DRAFT_733672 [Xylariomycetidae sp. FL2044]